MAQTLEFETERLAIRQWHRSDLAPFAALNADSRVMEHFPATLETATSDNMANRCRALIAQRGWGLWAVARKDTGDFVGFVGLHKPDSSLPCAPCIEIGWRLAFEHWGNGFATEAALGALRVGFSRLGLTEVVSFTAVGNERSRRVMEKIHMRHTGECFEHPAIPKGNALRLHCLYRLTLERWRTFAVAAC